MSDWDASDSDSPAANATSAPSKAPAKPAAKSKWADEDEEDKNVASDWDDSDEEEEEEEKPKTTSTTTTAPPSKKKMSIKQKIAEKEAERARLAQEAPDELYDESAVLNPREAALRARQQEVQADMDHAADLFGAAAIGDKDLESLLSYECRTKEDFQDFTKLLINTVIKRQQKKPLYPFFVEHVARELAMPLKDAEVRKVTSTLSTLANEKQKEARDAASGKKKKSAAKPALNASKSVGRPDTSTYDDFDNDDFM